jgi:hypothetical protein
VEADSSFNKIQSTFFPSAAFPAHLRGTYNIYNAEAESVYNLFQTGAGVILKERAHQSTIEFDWILSYLGDYQCPYEPLFISIRRSAAWAAVCVRDAARSTE